MICEDFQRETDEKRQSRRQTTPHLVVNDDVVLGRDVIGDVVVDDESEQSVKQIQVDLLVHLLECRLQHHIALALARLPHVTQVVDA